MKPAWFVVLGMTETGPESERAIRLFYDLILTAIEN